MKFDGHSSNECTKKESSTEEVEQICHPISKRSAKKNSNSKLNSDHANEMKLIKNPNSMCAAQKAERRLGLSSSQALKFKPFEIGKVLNSHWMAHRVSDKRNGNNKNGRKNTIYNRIANNISIFE